MNIPILAGDRRITEPSIVALVEKSAQKVKASPFTRKCNPDRHALSALHRSPQQQREKTMNHFSSDSALHPGEPQDSFLRAFSPMNVRNGLHQIVELVDS